MRSNYYNLTLKDFIELQQVTESGIEAKKKKLSIVYKIELEFFGGFTSEQIISLYSDFEQLESQPIKTTYKKRVKVGGRWFFVDYRLSQISSSQFIDISHFSKSNPIENIHKIVASCIRPINWRYGKPSKYNGDEHEEISELLLNSMKVKDAYPIMLFFLHSLRQIIGQYPNLFPKHEGGDFEQAQNFYTKWGWVATIDNLANHDKTKWDYFFNLGLKEFFNIVSYHIEHTEQIKKENGRNRLH